MARISLLGIPLDRITLKEAKEKILQWCTSAEQHHIVTPNPEMLVEAMNNEPFRRVLQSSALNLPDGAGLLWASKWKGDPLPERVTGVDMLHALCMDASVPFIFLLGGEPGIAERAALVLKQENPQLRIAGTYSGSPRPEDEGDILHRIHESGAAVLFVAFGAPKQELWIHRNLPKMPRIKVAMGVGGAFDFIAGKQKRAPMWMRSLHLEWVYRLMREPRRIGRIWNAVVVFPYFIIKNGKHPM